MDSKIEMFCPILTINAKFEISVTALSAFGLMLDSDTSKRLKTSVLLKSTKFKIMVKIENNQLPIQLSRCENIGNPDWFR